MKKLIEELSEAAIGCHECGVYVNNVSYAVNMVLLSHSICAMRTLLHVFKKIPEPHGLRYNATTMK